MNSLEPTPESIKTKALTPEGINSLLQAHGDEALLIASILDEVLARLDSLQIASWVLTNWSDIG
jgi:hypothetical protein